MTNAQWPILFAIALTGLFLFGCASNNVDPATPRAGTGYVDFYSDHPDLSWQVEELREGKRAAEVFAEFTPLKEPVLRLAFTPGNHQLRVAFLNRVITQPVVVSVDVQEGMITPVRVTLTEAGTTLVETRDASAGGTAYGRWGRRTRLRNETEMMYRVSAELEAITPFKRKSDLPYAKPSGS